MMAAYKKDVITNPRSTRATLPIT